MSEMVRNAEVRQEFWRPPADELHARAAQFSSGFDVALCDKCRSEFVMGARFCHVCGTERNPGLQAGIPRWEKVREYLASIRISEILGLPIASLTAFGVGMFCLIAAVAQGFRSAETVLDWQAVQLWRIEWLLAGIAAFVAGILLKKPSTSN
jgi:hypothetical protein